MQFLLFGTAIQIRMLMKVENIAKNNFFNKIYFYHSKIYKNCFLLLISNIQFYITFVLAS